MTETDREDAISYFAIPDPTDCLKVTDSACCKDREKIVDTWGKNLSVDSAFWFVCFCQLFW